MIRVGQAVVAFARGEVRAAGLVAGAVRGGALWIADEATAQRVVAFHDEVVSRRTWRRRLRESKDYRAAWQRYRGRVAQRRADRRDAR